GKVRELKNVVERAVFAADADQPVNEIVFDPFDSPYRPRSAPSATPRGEPHDGSLSEPLDLGTPFGLRERVATYEKNLLEQALIANRHNQRATAGHLGLTYNQLRNDLRKHGLLHAATPR
ncbi:MAG: phage shock protein operon transcriptional activator, partial [Proteobacteria bacterium]|nr:phage shock protein operon transcriptional activator [Pseudomonadota bacterium]